MFEGKDKSVKKPAAAEAVKRQPKDYRYSVPAGKFKCPACKHVRKDNDRADKGDVCKGCAAAEK